LLLAALLSSSIVMAELYHLGIFLLQLLTENPKQKKLGICVLAETMGIQPATAGEELVYPWR